jgi:hypothetical protein
MVFAMNKKCKRCSRVIKAAPAPRVINTEALLGDLFDACTDWANRSIETLELYGYREYMFSDAKDIAEIIELVQCEKYKKAYEKACHLDTIVRDSIPLEELEALSNAS